MSDPASPSGSLGRASALQVEVKRQVEGQPEDGLRPPYSPARAKNGTSDSSNELPLDANSRLGLPHSQSNKSIPSLESPSTSASPYSSLQYAPRQRATHANRTSQASFQSHTSLWKQQQQAQASSSNVPPSDNPHSPSFLTASLTSAASGSSPALSTMAIEGSSTSNERLPTSTDQLSAAEKLAKQQLRADAQELGLGPESVGWAILDRIQSAVEGEWRDLGELLNRGEATLLLPTSPLKSVEITLSHAYNHTIFSTALSTSPLLFKSSLKGKEREDVSMVTFKGLRADLVDDTRIGDTKLEFKSFIPRDDMSFVSLMKIATKRMELFSTLAPLPASLSTKAPYPHFRVLNYSTNLLLPPSLARKEPSNVRPSRTRSDSAGPFLSPDQQSSNRASASFATLFGGRRDKRLSAFGIGGDAKELKDLSEVGVAGVEEGGKGGDAAAGTLHVAQPTRSISIAVIDNEIHRSQVLNDISNSMTARIGSSLSSSKDKKALPDQIIDVVCSFAAIFVPPSTSNTTKPSPPSGSRSGSTDTEMVKSPINAVLNAPFLYSADHLADSFQDFFNSIRSQLEDMGEAFQIEEELQRIESIVCVEVYDRIFCPYMSLDVFHDEALASRIEALNIMGINLQHLGLMIPEKEGQEAALVRSGLEDIVSKCGIQLQHLGDKNCTSPGDKLNALVAAHKIIVDGLGELPKIEMVEEAEAEIQKDKEQDSSLITQQESPENSTMEATKEKATSSTSSADLILPILIFCIIKSNPPKLASNLLYIQRFRSESLVQGEASYCLVNVQAAVAFLENVEPSSLGLQGNVKLVTAKDLEQKRRKGDRDGFSTTIMEGNNTLSMPMRMRSRVAHDVGELAGISNRVITGVLGSSLGAFGRMMGAGTNLAMGIDAGGGVASNTAGERQPRKKSVEDIRGVLSGGAAAKLGSVLNKVVAMENEGKTPRETIEKSRPRPMPRRQSNNRMATDYGRDIGEVRAEQISTGVTSSKASISDRLASLPILSRAATSTSATSSPPTSHLVLQHSLQEPERGSTSPAPSVKDLPILPSTSSKDGLQRLSNRTDMLEPSDLGDALRSPINPARHLDSNILLSPAHSLIPQRERPHIPTSLQSPYPPVSRPPAKERPLHVVLASTGSVASVKIPLIIELLLKYENVRLQVISTKASSRFYDSKKIIAATEGMALDNPIKSIPYTVESLATENREASRGIQANQEEVARPRLHFWSDEDEWDHWDQVGDAILHIELRRWADIVLVAPCSANTLAKINAGLCDDLLTCLLRALSPSTPTYLFPAMNTLMYLHPLTARHLTFVRDVLGYKIIGPIEKKLACGDLGQGAMQEWSDIVGLLVQRYSLVKQDVAKDEI